MKNPQKPGEKELRVSDWLVSKQAPAPAPKPENPALDNTALSISAPGPKTNTDNHHSHDNNGAVAPAIDDISTAKKAASIASTTRFRAAQTAILEPPRHLEALGVQPQRMSVVAEAPPVLLPPPTVSDGEDSPMPFDVFRILGGIWEHKRKIALWAIAGFIIGFVAGLLRGDTYKASMVLMVRDVPESVPVETGHSYRPKSFDKQTLSTLLTSDALFQRMAPKMHPPVPAKDMYQYFEFNQTKGDCVELINLGASSAENAVYNVNLWGQEVMTFTQELQSRETKGTRVYLQRQTAEEQINAVQSELTSLRSKYSDGNPLIREKLAQLQSLQDRTSELDQQEAKKASIADEERKNMTGYFSMVSPANVEGTDSRSRWFKAAVLGAAGFFGLLLLNLSIALTRNVLDQTVRTSKELEYTISTPNIQNIPHLTEDSLFSANEVSSVWSRIVGASPNELVCFWSPVEHQQPHLVMQALLKLAGKRSIPLVWVDTEGATVQPPTDFQPIDLSKLTQPIEPGRYWLKLDIQAMTAVESDRIAAALVRTASQHRIPVWLGIQGPVQEGAAALARHAHRVKILATLGIAKRDFWKTQSELLKQSVKTPTEWLAVNYVPWYRW